jgi:hypothetical protein
MISYSFQGFAKQNYTINLMSVAWVIVQWMDVNLAKGVKEKYLRKCRLKFFC